MQLYLVRHGIAEDGGEGIPDSSRALTAKGRRRFQKTAAAFARQGRRLSLILTSPLVRAVQTAEILAGAADHGEVGVLQELDGEHDVASLRAALEKRAGKSKSVAVVGHEPQLSHFLAALTGTAQTDIDFKKGAIVRVDLEEDGKTTARWWLKPRTNERVKGLPLQKSAARKEAKSAPEKRARKRRSGNAHRSQRQPEPTQNAAAP